MVKPIESQGKDKIDVCVASLELTEENKKLTATKLRGFMGFVFVEDDEFHHHGERAYHYPLIQYKRIDNKLIVLGLCEYAKILSLKISQLDRVIIPGASLNIRAVDIRNFRHEISYDQKMYCFATPWIALNEENYRVFRQTPKRNQKEFLQKILVGNILSTLKGIGVRANERICVNLLNYRTKRVRVHGNTFEAFKGMFEANISLPDYIGLGKSVSKGFGTIRTVFKKPQSKS